MAVRALAEMTWKDVAAFVSPRALVLWPAGAIEAHGPHLPLATDVIIAEEMARRAASLLESKGHDVLLLPALSFSPASYAGAFAGTLSLSEETAAAQITDVAASLSLHGLKRIAIVNCHVDPANLRALRTACATSGILFPDITRKPWVLRLPDEFKTGGAHAGFFETSLMMAAKPSLVREEIRKSLPRVTVNLGEKIREGAKTFHECGGADAYFGDPASATAAEGDRMFETLAQIIVEAVTA